MKRILTAATATITLALIAFFAAGGGAKARVATQESAIITQQGERNPWTNLTINDKPGMFQFAVIGDRTGGHRPGVFQRAVHKINMLQPEFVMSVGDLIEGYSEDPGQWAIEWSEFERKLDGLDMPFFFTCGNHDMANLPMNDNWRRKFGRSYYSFRYQDVLFLVLNSEDRRPKDDRFRFGPEQHAFVRETLAANTDVRWTFVFFHKPVWQAPPADLERMGFTAIEDALQDRPYTVFVGHEHHYMKFLRRGREYFMLATTGGGSRLRGIEFGEFDHVAWVTMKDKQPIVSNVLLEGVQPNDILVTEERKK